MDKLELVCDICHNSISESEVHWDEDNIHELVCIWCKQNIEEK